MHTKKNQIQNQKLIKKFVITHLLESLLSLTVLWFTLKNQAILLDFLQFFLKTLFSKDTQEDDQTSANMFKTKTFEKQYFKLV